MSQSWGDKYVPQKIEDMILSNKKKKLLQKVLTELPNTILYGHPGTGKSTFMKILRNRVGEYVLKINASNENGIEIIRGKVDGFAKAASFSLFSNPDSVNKKIIFFEEADKLTEEAQNALKDLMDITKKETRFFFVCNDATKIIEPIKSRCSGYVFDLNDPPKSEIITRLSEILKSENVKFEDNDEIRYVIDKHYPDIRNIIGNLESYVHNGILKIPESIKIGILKKRTYKTAEQHRETTRARVQKWHIKQKKVGNKQISCTISGEAYRKLLSLKEKNGQSQGKIIEELLLSAKS
jgi:DNA polymerase III delta prime subunit